MSSPYFHHHFNTFGLVFSFHVCASKDRHSAGDGQGKVGIQQTGRAESALLSHKHSSALQMI